MFIDELKKLAIFLQNFVQREYYDLIFYFFVWMIWNLRYSTGYPKDLGPSRVIHFTSEREFVQLLHQGYPVVVAFTIRWLEMNASCYSLLVIVIFCISDYSFWIVQRQLHQTPWPGSWGSRCWILSTCKIFACKLFLWMNSTCNILKIILSSTSSKLSKSDGVLFILYL
jgi:hypothetical protein